MRLKDEGEFATCTCQIKYRNHMCYLVSYQSASDCITKNTLGILANYNYNIIIIINIADALIGQLPIYDRMRLAKKK